MTTIYLTEPPPSVNRMFANVPGKGRVKTRAYSAWRKTAMAEVMIQRPQKFLGRVDVTLRLPETVRGDGDNRLKATLDLIKIMRVIEDDSRLFVRKSSVEFAPVPRTEIEIVRAA